MQEQGGPIGVQDFGDDLDQMRQHLVERDRLADCFVDLNQDREPAQQLRHLSDDLRVSAFGQCRADCRDIAVLERDFENLTQDLGADARHDS